MIKRELTKLTIQHCKYVLRDDIIIGSAYAKDGARKLFIYNPLECEFKVKHGSAVVADSRQKDTFLVQKLLDIYNEL